MPHNDFSSRQLTGKLEFNKLNKNTECCAHTRMYGFLTWGYLQVLIYITHTLNYVMYLAYTTRH